MQANVSRLGRIGPQRASNALKCNAESTARFCNCAFRRESPQRQYRKSACPALKDYGSSKPHSSSETGPQWQNATLDTSQWQAIQNRGLWLGLGLAGLWLVGGEAAFARELPADSSPHFHPVAAQIQDLSQNDEFWSNLARYGRYFITVLLGTAYTAIKPLGGLLRRPVTAAIVVVVLVGLYFFVSATLGGMLGTNQEPLVLFDS